MTARVLVVDDILANVKLLEARLSAEYFDVLTAGGGQEAIDICERERVDVVLLDVMMPGMDGGTLARLIRVERPEIKIILISGYSEEIARGAVATGQDFHFLPKPFSLGQLALKVKDVLEEGAA